jgi:hypothetical protein
MSRTLRPLAAAATVLGLLAVPSGALASGGHPPNLTCDSSMPVFSGTYDNVTVPPGQTCNLSDSTVLGYINVETAANLNLVNSGSVGGSLLVGNQASSSEDSGWTISGGAAASNAGSMTFQGTVHGIAGNNTGTLALSSATVDGSIVWNKGQFGGAITSSVITGQVFLNGTTGDPAVGGSWFIAGPQLDGSQQEIDGNVVLTNNQVPIFIFFNHIKQSLICEGNTPPPFNSVGGFTNTVDGRSVGQCATVNPAGAASANAARAAIPAG